MGPSSSYRHTSQLLDQPQNIEKSASPGTVIESRDDDIAEEQPSQPGQRPESYPPTRLLGSDHGSDDSLAIHPAPPLPGNPNWPFQLTREARRAHSDTETNARYRRGRKLARMWYRCENGLDSLDIYRPDEDNIPTRHHARLTYPTRVWPRSCALVDLYYAVPRPANRGNHWRQDVAA
jgi:hypothetical protein